tara:strand:- start:368 stop:1177 length:810 start_codon:yes stop_codon:yes gene_type:complete
MMYDLTFIIPTRIESEDRLRNIISTVTYLLKHVPAKVIVKEVSGRDTFRFRALPVIKKHVSTENLTCLYEENNDALFCKSKVLNDLIVAADTKVIANYDADCILPLSSYHQAYGMIMNDEADIVYPYGCGVYQWKSEYNMEIFDEFMSKLDTSVLDKKKEKSTSTIGWCQFVNRQKYIDSYMMNENFVSWGYEDDEFYFRMSTLGNRIGRINDYVYHLEHSRTYNSWFNSPNFHNNFHLWDTLRKFDRSQLVSYYEQQEYLQTRKKQLA